MSKTKVSEAGKATQTPILTEGVDETKGHELYESYYTCHFFRLWGREEERNEKNAEVVAKNVILGNMQNFLDEAFGDVAGKVNERYFFIEFKRNREGISKETISKGHRKSLVTRLTDDLAAQTLANKGHFAGFPKMERHDALSFEPYFQATKPIAVGNVEYDLPQLYAHLTGKKGGGAAGGSEQLGWTGEDVKKYVKVMYVHLVEGEQVTNHAKPQIRAMLGVLDVTTGVFKGFVDNFDTLFDYLLRRIAAAEQANLAAMSSTKASIPSHTTQRRNSNESPDPASPDVLGNPEADADSLPDYYRPDGDELGSNGGSSFGKKLLPRRKK